MDWAVKAVSTSAISRSMNLRKAFQVIIVSFEDFSKTSFAKVEERVGNQLAKFFKLRS